MEKILEYQIRKCVFPARHGGTFSLGIQEAKASLVYKVSSWKARAPQRNAVSRWGWGVFS